MGTKKELTVTRLILYVLITLIVIVPLTLILLALIAGATVSSPFILIGFLVYKKWKYNLKVKSDERKYNKLRTQY